jgi:hypothetical protein
MIVPTPDAGSTGPKLSLKKTAQPTTCKIPPEANPAEREVITQVFKSWFLGIEGSVKEQLAEQLFTQKEQITLQCVVDTSALDPVILQVAQRALELKLPIALHVVEGTADDKSTVGFTYTETGGQEQELRSWKISSIEVQYPEVHPATWSIYRKNLGYRLTDRLNRWASQHIDNESTSVLGFLSKDKKTPVFGLVTDSFARYSWSEDELARGFRITQEFFAFDGDDGTCSIHLNDTNTTAPALYVPGINGRRLMSKTNLSLIQMILPIPDLLNSKEGLVGFLSTVFKAMNRKIPEDLKLEMETLFSSEELERGPKLTDQQAAKVAERQQEMDARRRENGLSPMTEVDRKKVPLAGSGGAKLEVAKKFRTLRGMILEDNGIGAPTKQEVLPLLARIASQIDKSGTIDKVTLDKVVELIPAYADKLAEL